MSGGRRAFASTLLFLSGLTGLVYELAWSKRLANVLGNSGQAHAVVLATFMGGLALGAFVFGRAADRARRPLALYGVLELGVGLYALVFPWLLSGLEQVYVALAPSLGGSVKVSARLLLASAALLPPTLLMGGSVPAMTKHLTRALGGAQRELSLVYAVNSLGAAFGCLLAGLVLVPARGLLITERSAAGLNVLLAVAALVLGRRSGAGAEDPPRSEGADLAPAQYGPRAVQIALVGTALAGFTSMLYETTWIRLLSIVIGGTSYAFTLILTAFIIGIALGSFWLSRRADDDALLTFGRMQLALAAAVCVALPTYERLPYVFIQLNHALEHAPTAWPLYQFLTFFFCGAVLVLPAFFLGAGFPAAARVALSSIERVGGELGRVYVWNTAGTVSGSLLGGLLLLPWLGLEGNFVVGLVLNVSAAGLALLFGGRPVGRATKLIVAATAVLVIVFAVANRGWSHTVVSAGRYSEWKQSFPSYAAFKAEVDARSQLVFYEDDVFASVMVGTQPEDRRFLRINGKVDGSNGDDADTQVLAAHLGVLFHERPVKRVLVVGIGAGITLGSLLAHPIEHLDVVEISPAVIQAAKLFAEDNRRALDDPRCHVHVEDARTFLALAQEPYDLIVSVPSNPWVSGVAGLFSTDFFEIAKTKLAPGGRIVQWIHTYASNLPTVQLVIRTLRHSFPHGTTWVGPDDLVLVASLTPQQFDVESVAAKLERPEVRDDLARVRVHELTTLLARQVHSDRGQLEVAGEGPVNTDDHNRLEYGSPVGYFVSERVSVPDERTGPSQGSALWLHDYVKTHPLTAAQAKDIYGSLAWVHAPKDALKRAAAEHWLSLSPDDVEARVAVAECALAQGNAGRAQDVLAPAISQGHREPATVAAWLDAQRNRVRREAAPWNVVDVASTVELGRQVAAEHPRHEALQEALRSLEASL